ncbi:MAG: type VI secretion system lipoprotein TssJ [Rhodobacteraceae bacterium]|nr:type VI secretion system lipoprotein TssJ [Paracoccaceae bacterium]
MTFSRRVFLAGAGATAALAACGPTGPGSVTIVAQATAGANRGADGADRPVTLQVIQMRGTGAFDAADALALQNPAAALGGDFIRVDLISLPPGGKATKTIGLDPGVAAIGVVAGFINPAGKAFRAKSAVSPTDNVTFSAAVGPGGLVLSPA